MRQQPEALLWRRHSNRLIDLVLWRLTGWLRKGDAGSWEREAHRLTEVGERSARETMPGRELSRREWRMCWREEGETCYRINKWLQRLHQRRKRDQEGGRLDLIDFPPGDASIMREKGRGGDGEADRDERKIDHLRKVERQRDDPLNFTASCRRKRRQGREDSDDNYI